LLDLNEEERDKGITVEVGRAYFETEKRRFTVLDCPGHRNYIQNMIEGAGQADVAVLVVSAWTGEFEAGFEKTGQTREHAMLAWALGAERIIICINKMDFCDWSQERYNYIKDQLYPFLRKQCGFDSEKIFWIGVEGLSGLNIKNQIQDERAQWYKDHTLFEALDRVPTIERTSASILRIPILTKQLEGNDVELFGKVECGLIKQGMKCTLLPTQEKITVH
jgi:peptide chain release factor subunit 3